mmetsp:Transcript_12614/g.21033  ORF Transcript_12614/g.21033 Transcript_12614/m.21033 type:complete len:228 (-) Transcript_12614:573-1256(-)
MSAKIASGLFIPIQRLQLVVQRDKQHNRRVSYPKSCSVPATDSRHSFCPRDRVGLWSSMHSRAIVLDTRAHRWLPQEHGRTRSVAPIPSFDRANQSWPFVARDSWRLSGPFRSSPWGWWELLVESSTWHLECASVSGPTRPESTLPWMDCTVDGPWVYFSDRSSRKSVVPQDAGTMSIAQLGTTLKRCLTFHKHSETRLKCSDAHLSNLYHEPFPDYPLWSSLPSLV